MAMSQPIERRRRTRVEARSLFGTRVLKWAMSLSAIATASPTAWRLWTVEREEEGEEPKEVIPGARKPTTKMRLHQRKCMTRGRARCAPAV